MRIISAQSQAETAAAAAEDVARALDVDRRGAPDFVALHFGDAMPAEALRAAARSALGTEALHGGSSCLGVMSRDGLALDTGGGAAALALYDPEGSYGTASRDLGDDATAAARQAAETALAAAGRPGELPDLVWLTTAPGREEQVLAGLRAVFGAETPIVGGSAADADVQGGWRQIGPGTSHADGVVVSVLFPSRPIASVYQSGYGPTGRSGVVTRVDGRRLYEIDGRPAMEVYRDWTGGAVPAAGEAPVSILADATFWPLGRVARHVAGVPFHLLGHPAVAYPDGSMDLFVDLSEGDRLWQMAGSSDSLVGRAGRVAAQAREAAGGAGGALVIYCGGCMLAVRERMEDVRAGVDAALGGAPWIGVFTFGEQGVPPGGQAEHGNLMISCTVFADRV